MQSLRCTSSDIPVASDLKCEFLNGYFKGILFILLFLRNLKDPLQFCYIASGHYFVSCWFASIGLELHVIRNLKVGAFTEAEYFPTDQTVSPV